MNSRDLKGSIRSNERGVSIEAKALSVVASQKLTLTTVIATKIDCYLNGCNGYEEGDKHQESCVHHYDRYRDRCSSRFSRKLLLSRLWLSEFYGYCQQKCSTVSHRLEKTQNDFEPNTRHAKFMK